MKLTEQQFLDSLNTDQAEYFNKRLIELRDHFQATYAESVASVSAAKDQLLANTTEELRTEKQTLAEQLRMVTEMTNENVNLKSTIASHVAQQTSLTAERDSLNSQVASLAAEVARLTALVPPPVQNYMITPSAFVERLEAASPGVISRLWGSETAEAGQLAVTLFTWSDRIDCRPGGRLEGYLNLIVQLGLMDADSVAKVWI
jgi:hypothetical protein